MRNNSGPGACAPSAAHSATSATNMSTAKGCGNLVEDTCMSCGSADDRTIFCAKFGPNCGRCTVWMRLRSSFRLNDPVSSLELPLVTCSFLDTNVNVHRYEETINGRAHLIEVSSVGTGKWRAQIKRTPGGSGALMPFYGQTP